jgi:hypothetical protein
MMPPGNTVTLPATNNAEMVMTDDYFFKAEKGYRYDGTPRKPYRRRPTGEPIPHGTISRYTMETRAGEVCDECRAAKREYMRAYRASKAVGRG